MSDVPRRLDSQQGNTRVLIPLQQIAIVARNLDGRIAVVERLPFGNPFDLSSILHAFQEAVGSHGRSEQNDASMSSISFSNRHKTAAECERAQGR